MRRGALLPWRPVLGMRRSLMGDSIRPGENLTPERFLREQAAPRFGALVAAAERRLVAAQKEVGDLREAVATICWAAEASPRWYMNISAGVMEIGSTPAREPLMTVQMEAAAWELFASGAVHTGFLDAPSGRRGFGRSRIERLEGVHGTFRFVLTGLPGGGEWACILAFGGEPAPEPQATVTVDADTLAQIQSGQVEAQVAFLQGRVKVAGDAGLVMQLGMAMFM